MNSNLPFQSQNLSGWGRYPSLTCRVFRPERGRDLDALAGVLPRGMGRSYGDAALDEIGGVAIMPRMNRLLAFDDEDGLLEAEAGLSLAEVGDLFMARGWFLPVTPGTKFVSLGGAIAADVHGKNHHVDGCLSRHVEGLELLTVDGNRHWCSRTDNPEWFLATIGGLGLTGTITRVKLRLMRIPGPWLKVQHHAAPNLERVFQMLSDSSVTEPYTVAWIDCLASGKNLGRSVFMTGEHIEANRSGGDLLLGPGLKVPFDLPSWILNPVGLRAFNALFYRLQGYKTKPFLSDFDSFFYPLDKIGSWNRIYGKKGLIQYQCVLPEACSFEGMTRILEAISAAGAASFLAVLKRMGDSGEGMLSFPMPGFTLALDLPFRGESTLNLTQRLDELVLRYGGRINLCKDACLAPASFRGMYPKFGDWLRIKAELDPKWVLNSALARRLQLDRGL